MIGPAGVTIRSGRAEEMAALAAIADEGASTRPEAEAGVPLDPTGRLLPARLAACRAEDLLWTAADGADRPVGVLVATIADDALHVVTLAIVRAHRRRGVGRALLERAIGHGRWAFFPAVTVTAGVEAPFYRRFGFVALRSDRLPPDLAAFLRAERDADGPGVERIAMAKVL